MGMSNNVIQFPKAYIDHPARTEIAKDLPAPDLGEIKDVYYLLKTKRAEEMMGIVIPLITQGFLAYGVAINDKNNIKNIGFMIEAIRAAIYGYYDIEHPLHPLAKNMLREVDGKIILREFDVAPIPAPTSNTK